LPVDCRQGRRLESEEGSVTGREISTVQQRERVKQRGWIFGGGGWIAGYRDEIVKTSDSLRLDGNFLSEFSGSCMIRS